MEGFCWDISFDYEVRSSSTDDGEYSIPYNERCFVITYGESLSDVRRVLKESLTCQEHLIEIRSAVFKGRGLYPNHFGDGT